MDFVRRSTIVQAILAGVAAAVMWGILNTSAEYFTFLNLAPSKDMKNSITVVEEPEDGLYRGRWKDGLATVFWVGEGATDENGFIHNESSAWDVNWMDHFGGVDDPEDRCGYYPCAFTPNENPFYVALPYNDMHRGRTKSNASAIPWYEGEVRHTILKNRWVEVSVGGNSCFGQWQDVGPFETDDVEYVFGNSEWPLNEQIAGAGIDLSPALRDCLAVGDTADVRWRHVEATAVPEGPWTEIITRSP